MRTRTTSGLSLPVLSVCLLLAAVSGANAGILADFMPSPASPLAPEFIWTGLEFTSGPGAHGTNFGLPGAGDGQLPEDQQAAPGLLVTTPYTVAGVPGGTAGATGTSFHDATLQIVPTGAALLGLPASGPASILLGQVFQPLGGGIVRLWSTDPAELAGPDVENPVLLLEGVISDAVITGIAGGNTGATLSAHVLYTSGAILDAAGLSQVAGEFSWSLLDVNPPLGMTGQGGLIPFEANAVGQFSAVPEPATLSLVVLGSLGLLRRRRAE